MVGENETAPRSALEEAIFTKEDKEKFPSVNQQVSFVGR
jgi:hypothetical protein